MTKLKGVETRRALLLDNLINRKRNRELTEKVEDEKCVKDSLSHEHKEEVIFQNSKDLLTNSLIIIIINIINLIISFSPIPVVTSCIHKFRGLSFILLPGGHHSKIFKVTFLHSFFAHGHTCSTVCILCNIRPKF